MLTGAIVGRTADSSRVSYLAGGRKADLATVLEIAAKPVAGVRQVAGT